MHVGGRNMYKYNARDKLVAWRRSGFFFWTAYASFRWSSSNKNLKIIYIQKKKKKNFVSATLLGIAFVYRLPSLLSLETMPQTDLDWIYLNLLIKSFSLVEKHNRAWKELVIVISQKSISYANAIQKVY